ncbi:MAG: PAS domain-containing protein [Candidatus Coatesbacteria bacterium]|nr:MAG: PAS domain-containing protein [Candidatus Coatesbacteria bacterium]
MKPGSKTGIPDGLFAELEALRRKLAEAEETARRLRQVEGALQEAQRLAHLGSWDWDVPTDVATWSDEVYRIFGFTPQEFGATYGVFLASVHPEDRPAVMAAMAASLADPEVPYDIEHRIVRPDGSERIVHGRGKVTFGDGGKPVRMIGTVHDVTELKSAEFRYRTVADFTYDWEYWRGADGRFLYVSPSCERISGYKPEAFVDDPELIRELVLPEDRDLWDEHREEGEMTPGIHEARFRLRTRRGEVRWIEHMCQPVTSPGGEFLGIRASNRDVTERERSVTEAARLRQQLLHATRVAAMGELTASLAHELTQPLTAILSNAQAALRLLAANPPDLEEVRASLADIVDDDKRAADVIKGVRALLVGGDSDYSPVDANDVIRQVAALTRNEALAASVDVRLELAHRLKLVRGDRVQLQQVVLNLMLNALEAMGEQGYEPREIAIGTAERPEGEIVVTVRDSGPGIAAAPADRLFESFFTTKREGLGMGLAVSRAIVERHGGRIWFENNAEGGATFFVTLPAAEGEAS